MVDMISRCRCQLVTEDNQLATQLQPMLAQLEQMVAQDHQLATQLQPIRAQLFQQTSTTLTQHDQLAQLSQEQTATLQEQTTALHEQMTALHEQRVALLEQMRVLQNHMCALLRRGTTRRAAMP